MASSSNQPPFQAPTLTSKNYDVWLITMKNFHRCEDYWQAIENGFIEPNPIDIQVMINAQIQVITERKKNLKKGLKSTMIHPTRTRRSYFSQSQSN